MGASASVDVSEEQAIHLVKKEWQRDPNRTRRIIIAATLTAPRTDDKEFAPPVAADRGARVRRARPATEAPSAPVLQLEAPVPAPWATDAPLAAAECEALRLPPLPSPTSVLATPVSPRTNAPVSPRLIAPLSPRTANETNKLQLPAKRFPRDHHINCYEDPEVFSHGALPVQRIPQATVMHTQVTSLHPTDKIDALRPQSLCQQTGAKPWDSTCRNQAPKLLWRPHEPLI